MLPAGFANKVADAVLHIGLLLEGAAVGNALTVSVVVYTAVEVQPDSALLLNVSE